MTLGNRIKNLRLEKNISQEKMALDINVSRQTISKWENDSVLPDSNSISIICDYFNVSADYLLKGNEEEKNIENRIIFDRKWLIIYITFLVIGTIVLVFGILFLTVDVFKDSVRVSTTSSFVDIPVGIILLVVSGIIFATNGIRLFLYLKKRK